MNEVRTGVLLFLTGALVGSIGAVFATPWSGTKTRRLLRRKLREGQEHVAEVAAGIRETGNELWDKGETVVKDAERMFA